jgi:energy-coupling factor transport system substrate-specific component
MPNRLLSFALYLTTTLLGMTAFLHPFLDPGLAQNLPLSQVRAGEAPLMYTLLLGLCVVVLLFEVQGQAVDAKLIALLGMLVAINSALRFIEVAIPGPGGFSPVFFLIILTGYIFGGRFGFIMGALTMLVSSIVTGGVGPWLPSQMFAAGWIGMSAPLVARLGQALRLEGKPAEIGLLAIFGAMWGLGYGLIMNLWSWPYIAGTIDQYYTPGSGAAEVVRRYAVYYLITSLAWDLAAAAGNVLLIVLAGVPTLRVLRRFQRRFSFSYQAEVPVGPGAAATPLAAGIGSSAVDAATQVQGVGTQIAKTTTQAVWVNTPAGPCGSVHVESKGDVGQ